ncbi:hypothetical protein KKH3_21470 [Pectobacterium actinidiae]|nr:hypothetical protein KKH3_21470 [Pectobacterium actinidiae]
MEVGRLSSNGRDINDGLWVFYSDFIFDDLISLSQSCASLDGEPLVTPLPF